MQETLFLNKYEINYKKLNFFACIAHLIISLKHLHNGKLTNTHNKHKINSTKKPCQNNRLTKQPVLFTTFHINSRLFKAIVFR